MIELPTIDLSNPESCLVKLDELVMTDAGSIQNLWYGDMGHAAVIRSKAGSIRSNHYHKTDWHLLYVFRGAGEYYQRAVGDEKIHEPLLFYAGMMIYTPPMVEHAFKFSQDTTMFSIAKLPRTHETHEADLVRVKFL